MGENTMKDADPRARVTRLAEGGNYLGAYLYLKEAELERLDHVELVGVLAGAVADELSRTRRDDRERIYYLRSLLAWILRDVPGLGPLYREQLRDSRSRGGLLGSFARGIENAGDIAGGRKSVADGLEDVSEDVRRNLEDAAEAVQSGEAGTRLNEFLNSAEQGIRDGIDQIGAVFRSLNEQTDSVRGQREETSEDAEFTQEGEGMDPGATDADDGDVDAGGEDER